MIKVFHTKLFWLLTWLAVFAWVILACVPAQAPQPTAEVAEPAPVEAHEAEHEDEHEDEAEMAELEPVSLGPGEKLQVVATTNIVAHVVSQIGGDAIHLTGLLPIGVDPHTYVPTPQDVAAVADAHIIFANGANLEADFLPELTQDVEAPVIHISHGIEFREFGEAHEHEHEGEEHEHEAEGHHYHEEIDPHTWTTPANVLVFVRNVEHALSAFDPANAQSYAANAKAYEAELEALDEWVKAQIETVPAENRELVTDHTAFGYYADRYGLEQIGAVIPAFSTAAQPSAQELAALEDVIREYGVKAVFVGTTVNPALSEQVAGDTGIQLVTLYTGSLGPEGSDVETYIAYTCYNTVAIVEALGGTVDVAGSPCE
jgi:manganese/iron transport system substrate-binding protein